ncbi:hypothetical protein [Nonomuraea sp. NPDC050786]|uniref:hypothetical protein n=1 Tax=Nonomuraea sp. NPDC050786 TaxID=3154840 RepID=UPI0033EA0977
MGAALRADITTLRREGAAEVSLASGEDADRITTVLITLGGALAETLTPMAADESLPPMMRGAARMAADAPASCEATLATRRLVERVA